MYKIKKRMYVAKPPVLYNIIEDYTEFDPPGNVTACAMTVQEDLEIHAKVLSEAYEIAIETMRQLLSRGGVYAYAESGGLMTGGAFVCHRDPSGQTPKQTWMLDMVQYAESEQVARSYGLPFEEAAKRVFYRTLAPELRNKLGQKNLGLNYANLDPAVARGGDIKYIDFRKDWSPHFKRLCIMPDGRLIETGGVAELASLHGITLAQARKLVEQGGTLEVGDEVLACQVVNGQPALARFSRAQYGRAKELMRTKGVHIMDALSEVGLSDPTLMSVLRRLEQRLGS